MTVGPEKPLQIPQNRASEAHAAAGILHGRAFAKGARSPRIRPVPSGELMDRWFDGVYLIGRYNYLQTGVWLLAHNGEAAVLELPPTGILGLGFGADPAADVAHVAQELGVAVKYLLCTHAHHDHFSTTTFRHVRERFPRAEPVLQSGFRKALDDEPGVRYFDDHC